MARQKVTLEQLAQILIALPEQLEREHVKALQKAAMRLVVYVEHSIREHQPYPIVDRGMLVQSVMLIFSPKGAIVRVDAPYAPMMEYGTRPFMPPLAPLLEWAKRKGFEDPEAIARAVRWKFKRRGMAPKRFFAAAVAQWKASGTITKAVQDAFAPGRALPSGGGTP